MQIYPLTPRDRDAMGYRLYRLLFVQTDDLQRGIQPGVLHKAC